MKIKEEDSLMLRDFLERHVIHDSFNKNFTGSEDLRSFCFMVKKYFPRFIYSGHCYRVVFLNKKENFDPKINIGNSFSSSKTGIQYFVDNHVKNNSPKYISVIEGYIEGVDIYSLSQELFEIGIIRSHPFYLNEDEILFSKGHSLSVSFFTYNEYKKWINKV